MAASSSGTAAAATTATEKLLRLVSLLATGGPLTRSASSSTQQLNGYHTARGGVSTYRVREPLTGSRRRRAGASQRQRALGGRAPVGARVCVFRAPTYPKYVGRLVALSLSQSQ